MQMTMQSDARVTRTVRACVVGLMCLAAPLFAHASESNGTIQSGFGLTRVCKNAACSSYGNINFKPTLNSNTPGAVVVTITDSGLSGHLWGDEIGWVNLSPTGGGVSINPTTGALSGKAYANAGSWINFSPTTVGGGTQVGVSINAQGEFVGWAYVSGLYGGWVKFDCATGNTCIKTDWRPLPARVVVSGGGGGGGGGGAFYGTTVVTPKPATPTPSTTPDPTKQCSMRQIAPGTRHADVAKIQTFLINQGYLFAALDSVGYYGSATKASIRAFQNKYPQDILIPAALTKPTGNWAFYTAKKAKELGLCLEDAAVAVSVPQTGSPTPATTCLNKTLRPGTRNSADVRVMQAFLIAQGYSLVEVTGYYGPTTKQAVSFFQKRYAKDILVPNNLTSPTGIWGPSSAKKATELGLCTYVK